MGDLTRGAQGPINVVPLRTWDKAYLKELWTNWYLSSQTRGPLKVERERERERELMWRQWDQASKCGLIFFLLCDWLQLTIPLTTSKGSITHSIINPYNCSNTVVVRTGCLTKARKGLCNYCGKLATLQFQLYSNGLLLFLLDSVRSAIFYSILLSYCNCFKCRVKLLGARALPK